MEILSSPVVDIFINGHKFTQEMKILNSIRGVFQIKLLNVNLKSYTSYLMNRERKIGSLNKMEPAVASVESIDSKLSENLESNILYRDNLSVAQRTKICTLVSEYRDMFARKAKTGYRYAPSYHHQ